MAHDASLIAFATPGAMAERLADLISLTLDRGVEAQGLATIALSGGSTPAPLYRALARRNIDWSNVAATLVDERFVPPGATGSNETLLRENFLTNEAAKTRFVGFWSGEKDIDAAAKAASEYVRSIVRPFDVVVMGMGADGHTASWFPGADGLDRALGRNAPLVAPVVAKKSEATGEFRQRLTLSLPAIADARLIVLVISGEDKRRVFAEALKEGPVEAMPVRAILRARADLWAAWAP